MTNILGIDVPDWVKYTNPITAAQEILPDEVNSALWPQGNVLNSAGDLSLGGSGNAPTAAPLTPEQVASISGGYANPSAQGPVTGIDLRTTYQTGPGGLQIPVVEHVPTYGPSVRDQAMAGFNAGPRDAPQVAGAQMANSQMSLNQMKTPANVTGATINPMATYAGDRTATTGLNIAASGARDSSQTRGVQQSQTDRLTTAADGGAPSVAENQLRSGLAQGMQSNLALAASNRGSGSGSVLAQRSAQDANASMATRTNAQAAQLRAGEIAQARADLTGHLGQVRSGDIAGAGIGTQIAGIGVQQAGIGAQLGQAQAGLTQQANLANQSTQLATGQANLGAAQQTGMANLAAAQQTGMANLNATQQTQLANAQLVMQQQGMDDQQKMAYLGAVLGIDARTQQGQMQLQQLLVNAKLTTDATNAGIGLGNAQNATNMQNGLIAGGATLGAALI